jgi:hypothetical protein
MHRQQTIFIALLLIMAVALVALGYSTGQGPLGIVSTSISRLTSENK